MILKRQKTWQRKIESDFPPRHQTQNFEYKNRVGETVKADDKSGTPSYGKSNQFGVFQKGKRVKTIDYDTAKSEYDYELSFKSK